MDHHHVLHPGIPAAQPEWEAAMPQAAANGRHSIDITHRKAITAAPLSPGDLGQRLGRLGGRILQPARSRRMTGGQATHKTIDKGR